MASLRGVSGNTAGGAKATVPPTAIQPGAAPSAPRSPRRAVPGGPAKVAAEGGLLKQLQSSTRGSVAAASSIAEGSVTPTNLVATGEPPPPPPPDAYRPH